MKISGFTIIRNGVEFDYPFLESIQSLLPLVDEFIVNVGRGTDNTIDVINQLAKRNSKIKVIQSTWPLDDAQKRKSGKILAEQTNLALDACQGDWCIYLQADELLHERDHFLIRRLMKRHLHDEEVEGLLFDYLHFYGSYDVIQETRSAYRREVRAFKRSSTARSIGDAQSFRKASGSKLKVIKTSARIFHYGWVRSPDKMKSKTLFMDGLYHGENDSTEPHSGENYRYKKFWGLKTYQGGHPRFIHSRINEKGWHWDLSHSDWVWEFKDVKKVISDGFEKLTGIRLFEYRCYELIPQPPLKPRSDQPIISLIVSTFNNPKPLELVLHSLSHQTCQNFELILCDDGSDKETQDLVSHFKLKSHYAIEYLWQENKGFRKCRILNEALRRSRGEIIVFLDGDCVPSKYFIEDHLMSFDESHYSAGRRIELGKSLSETLSLKNLRNGFFDHFSFKLFWDCLFGESKFYHRIFRIKNPVLRKILGMTKIIDMKGCNYSVSKEALIEINGFDEAYEGYGREDTDAEIRLQILGLKIKSLKGIAAQFHVWHPRLAFTPANEDRLEKLKQAEGFRCINGIDKKPLNLD